MNPNFSAFKDLTLFETVSKFQEASSILRMGFAHSKLPHLHRKWGFIDSQSVTTVLLWKGLIYADRHAKALGCTVSFCNVPFCFV